MFSVFASFVSSDDLVVKSFGAVLAFGVLVDAFLVRMTLVPAVLAMLKDRAWHLPGWLDRHVPDLDVEGEHLIEQLEREAAEKPRGEAPAEPAPAGQG
jgi:RND superfamily putative drug exporter